MGNMDEMRRRQHIQKHTQPDDPRCFLDERSMGRAKWDEAVIRARARREGIDMEKLVTGHYSCSCGSYECLGIAVPKNWPRKK